ncbi:MAG TPA: host attachment protein [Gammaproteobacteria bacterium]|nr:host attachment protein [Gammaproteobacteria bacterium]
MATTWVVVADAARARIFSSRGGKRPLVELETLTHPVARIAEREIGSDEPGRAFDSHGKGRHALTDKGAIKQHETEEFAREIAARLDAARKDDTFQHLILVAPPSMLGALREHLPSPSAKRLFYALDKDLTQDTGDAIRARLPEFFPNDLR